MSPELRVRLVPPSQLVSGLVNTRINPNVIDMRISDSSHISDILPDLIETGQRIIDNTDGTPPPICRCYVERDTVHSPAVDAEITCWQIDIHIRHRGLSDEVGDEIAGHLTDVLRQLREKV